MSPLGHRATGFGLHWRSDIALDMFDTTDCSPVEDRGEIDVRRVAALAPREPLRTVNRGQLYADGVRLGWSDEVSFDMFDGRRIEYLPGPGWAGTLPPMFYSTIAALTLAWRGVIPFHACTVEIDGQGVLILGPAGAGKSSLTAGLIGLGARFVADDLSAVAVAPDGRASLFRGRPAMRQHRDTATQIEADLCVPIPGDPRHKWWVRPTSRTSQAVLPLSAMLLLTHRRDLNGAGRFQAMREQLFRPKWLAALPNRQARQHDLMKIAAAVPIAAFPPIAVFDPEAQGARAHQALAAIHAMLP